MERSQCLSDGLWQRLEPLLPPLRGRPGRPFREHRPVVEAIVYRYRTGIPWRDLPAGMVPWQTAWKRHAKWSKDGTWDRVLVELLAEADAVGALDWTVSADSTIGRAHQHATNTRREVALPGGRYTGGSVELQESARGAA